MSLSNLGAACADDGASKDIFGKGHAWVLGSNAFIHPD